MRNPKTDKGECRPVHRIGLILAISLLTLACTMQEVDGDKPNILFCIADDATYLHMGAYGCSWVKTPSFDRIARQGILFQNAFTPNAKCAPSRSCILTGRNSWQLEEAANHWCYFPDKYITFTEVLAANGYHVGFTGKGLAPVVSGIRQGKEREVLGRKYNQRRCKAPTSGISELDYTANFEAFLQEKEAEEAFFFWYGGFEPHRSYEFGSGEAREIDRIFQFWPDKDSVRQDLFDYALELEHFDLHLGRMIRLLEESGELENTLIVVTADNGMPFPRIKGQAYEYSNHLPLAIMWPRGIREKGRVVDDFISFIDLAPTFLDLAGIAGEDHGMQPMQGSTFTDILFSPASGRVDNSRDHVLLGKERHDVGRPGDSGYPIRAIRTGDYLFVKNFEKERWPSGDPLTGYLNCDGGATKTQILSDRRKKGYDKYWNYCFGYREQRELYHIASDPDCIHNLFGQENYQDIAAELEQQLIRELNEQDDPRMKGEGDVFDNYPYANVKTRDFYHRYVSGEQPEANWVNATDFEMERIQKMGGAYIPDAERMPL